MKWKKISKTINSEGVTILYEAAGTAFAVESRKRHIPHTNGKGHWDHTTYFVLKNGQEVTERNHLSEAKEYVEKLLEETDQ